jgi:hypothetical protein
VFERSFEAVGVCFVAYDERDFDARQSLALDGVDERLQVAS